MLRTVINLSSRQLSESETFLLSKGLNFAITPKELNKLDIVASVESVIEFVEPERRDDLRYKIKD